MIDLSRKPDAPIVAVDQLPKLIVNAATGEFKEQRDAIQGIQEIQRDGVSNLFFVNTFREVFLASKPESSDRWDEEFNKLLTFLSSISMACANTIALIERDRRYDEEQFLDSNTNRQESDKISIGNTQQQTETVQ